MSGDILNSWLVDPASTNVAILENLTRRRVRDTLVFFDGAFEPRGIVMDIKAKTELVQFQQQYRNSHDHLIFAPLKVVYVKGHFLRRQKHITEALRKMVTFIDPRGLLLVIGNSAGGVDAIEFCRQMALAPFFKFRTDRLSPEYESVDKGPDLGHMVSESGPWTMPIEIDMLWINNGGFSVESAKRTQEAAVPNIVAGHVNYFMEAYNPPNDDPVAAKSAEFHDRTSWPRKERESIGLNFDWNVPWPAPFPPKSFPPGWSAAKAAEQLRNHTEVITKQMEPAALAEAEALLNRRVDLSKFKDLLKQVDIRAAPPPGPHAKMMVQRFRAFSGPWR